MIDIMIKDYLYYEIEGIVSLKHNGCPMLFKFSSSESHVLNVHVSFRSLVLNGRKGKYKVFEFNKFTQKKPQNKQNFKKAIKFLLSALALKCSVCLFHF